MKGIGKKKKKPKQKTEKKERKGKKPLCSYGSTNNQASEQKVNTVSCQLCVDIQEREEGNKNRPSLI